MYESDTPPTLRPRHALREHILGLVAASVVLWVLLAYLLVPEWWTVYERRHPSLHDTPGITQTHAGIPGDPVNVALVGSRDDLERAMQAAGWKVADALGLRSDVRIAADTVLDRPYEAAPVSSLFLFGRREDVAFEMAVGDNPQHRHHVRFWKSAHTDADGRPIWVGSASYDKGIGLSHTTGQITHHIASEVDVERDHVIESLQAARQISENWVERDFHKVRSGKNGGGDPWSTDGDLWAAVIIPSRREHHDR